MKKITFALFALTGICLMTSCTDTSSGFDADEVCPATGKNYRYGGPNRGKFVDERDGQVYKYITIGDKIWMDQNLNYASETSVCYDELQSNCDVHGRLYSVQYMNTRNANYGKMNYDILDTICPKGWRVPKLSEWKDVVDKMGGLSSFKKGECTHLPTSGEHAYFYNDEYTGEPTEILFDSFGYRIWITETASEYGSLRIFSPDFDDCFNSAMSITTHGYYSLRCIKKEDWEL